MVKKQVFNQYQKGDYIKFDANNIQPGFLIKMYKTMVKIRKTEEKIGELIFAGEVRCPCHLCVGQEAIATGVCLALNQTDYVFTNYRGHGHYLAKGGELKKMMAEVYGKVTGCSRGKGGSMHLIAPEVSIIFGSTAIVAGQIAPAVGAALASQLKGDKRISVVFFGDGATEEGVFFESLNFAALKKLPIVFICENNLYSSHFRIEYRQPIKDLYIKTKYLMSSIQIDGNNVIEVFNAAKEAIERARSNDGPTFIECLTYRHRGHVGPNLDVETVVTTSEEYARWANLNTIKLAERAVRFKEELEKWLKLDPIKNFEKCLIETKIFDEKMVEEINEEINKEVDAAVDFARSSDFPKTEELSEHVYAQE